MRDRDLYAKLLGIEDPWTVRDVDPRLEDFYFGTPLEHLQTLESVSMDMWGPYVQATLLHVPDAERKIAFDRFHVAKHINDGVNKVRVDEHAELREAGERTLTGTRYLLYQPELFTRFRPPLAAGLR